MLTKIYVSSYDSFMIPKQGKVTILLRLDTIKRIVLMETYCIRMRKALS